MASRTNELDSETAQRLAGSNFVYSISIEPFASG
jgi:hypothetical protein